MPVKVIVLTDIEKHKIQACTAQIEFCENEIEKLKDQLVDHKNKFTTLLRELATSKNIPELRKSMYPIKNVMLDDSGNNLILSYRESKVIEDDDEY